MLQIQLQSDTKARKWCIYNKHRLSTAQLSGRNKNYGPKPKERIGLVANKVERVEAIPDDLSDGPSKNHRGI
jgi:hypothetical protein